jgi:group I intron endonuclease
MNRKGIIYLAVNKINNKKYIGQTIHNLETRIKWHLRHSKIAKIGFDYAIKKYGFHNFTFDYIRICKISELNKLEKYYIKKLKTYAPLNKKYGYNLTVGGDNNFGCKGEFHYLNRMGKNKKKQWMKKYRLGKNNPNYNNSIISGKNHYLNKMSIEERENWLNKNLRGKNNYQSKLNKKQLKNKCWMNNVSKKEKQKYINKYLKGKNNPYYKKMKLQKEKTNESSDGIRK